MGSVLMLEADLVQDFDFGFMLSNLPSNISNGVFYQFWRLLIYLLTRF